jgi:hypothetical protein
VAQGAGSDRYGDLAGAMEFQYAGGFAERRAGGHHVVYQ